MESGQEIQCLNKGTEIEERKDIPFLVFYNGKFDDRMNYENYEASGHYISANCNYEDLQQKLKDALECNQENTVLQLKYQVKEGYQPLRIKDDQSLHFYIQLKLKDPDFTTYPMCVNVINNPTTTIDATFFGNDNSLITHRSAFQPIEYNAATTEDSTNQQHIIEARVLEFGEESFDFMDYAKLVAEEMVEQLENNRKKEPEITDYDELLITDPHHPEIEEAQIYKDKETLQSVLGFYAIRNNFQFRVKKSCARTYKICCLDPKCKWALTASRNGPTKSFIIRKYDRKVIHTCDLNIRFADKRQATTKLIGNYIKPRFTNIKTTQTPQDIRGEMKHKYGVRMNYMKAWRSKEHAQEELRGKANESYRLLFGFLHMLQKTNPGTIVHMETEDDNSFKYLFVALDASIKGWKKCKPIIVVDGTFLKSTYGGTLLSACTQDANGHIFPLAFSVVDSENNNSWQWFFTKVRETYGIREEQCLISDRHESISKAACQVFPEITHCYCVYHLLSNLKATFKKNASKLDKPFFAAARAYTERKFEYHMSELDSLDIRVRPYLQQVGYHKWSRYHCKNNRYSTMTSNIAESLNAANLAARELPITTLMESLRALIQQWTYTNRKKAQKTTTFLTPTAEKKLVDNFVESLTENVKPINETMFEVIELTRSWVINLKEKTCSCN
ncbi:uncharacterized protein LOC133037218 [Cannabis sativa]|uniref:uncharacterized protein LOC133037218 n=3 Tax=Cannabis sativa TaxID=3483 RepID=UPI0029CA48D9|nr:uncharacterized protein LOC133037218 [Cannabis sativa]